MTVTYGDRFELLERAIGLATRAGVRKWVVVGNGIEPAYVSKIEQFREKLGVNLNLVRLPRNIGSAGGFAAGISEALGDPEVQFVWLMDDDNGPRSDALSVLLARFEDLSSEHPADRLALMCLRSDRPMFVRIANGVDPKKLYPPPKSLLGFHILVTPLRLATRVAHKIRKLVGWHDYDTVGGKTSPMIEIPFAPYSGLFLHRDLLVRIGLPDKRFVLYGDDTEFSSRIVETGGKLLLVSRSLIDDLEPSWHVSAPQRTFFGRLLWSDSEFRIYYRVRNEAYLAYRAYPDDPMLGINRVFFCAILWALAVWSGRTGRYRLIRQALADGKAGRLGIRDDFPLP